MSNSKGATWSRWDPHIHSPASFENDYSVDTEESYDSIWEKYIDELSQIEKVSCLGITDYFCIDGYEKVRQAKDDGRLNNLDLVFPNIELRIDDVVVERGDKEGQSGSSRSIDLHILFSEELDPRTIRNNFLHRVDAHTPDGEKISLSKENIKRLGRKDGFEQFDERSGDDFQIGCERINVDRESVFKALNKEIFEGKYLVVLDDSVWDDIPWKTRSGTLRATLASKVDAFFSSNDKTRQFLIGEHNSNTPEEVISAFGSLKPCIHGSDAHDFSSLCNPDKDRYCWIKAEPTFEGLKQIKYEPKERVKVQSEDPQGHIPGYTPEKVEIRDGTVNDSLTVTDTDLPLNPNLVTVIGGKGAGKTTLLDLVAHCFDDRCLRDNDKRPDENSFIQRIESEEPEILTRLRFDGDDVEGFNKRLMDEEIIESAQVEYLPQGKISEYCRKKQKLHNQIIEVIKSSVRKSDRRLMERFNSQLDEIDKLEEKLHAKTRSLYEYDPETITERIQEARSEVKTTETKLEDKRNEINQYREAHKEDLKSDTATDFQKEIDTLEESIEDREQFKSDISEVVTKLEELVEVNERIERISKRADSYDFDVSVDIIQYEDSLHSLREIKGLVKEEIGNLEGKKRSVKSELEELEDAEEELSEMLTEKRDIKSDLEEKRGVLSNLENNREEIQRIKKERRKAFKEYVAEYVELKRIYGSVIHEFNEDRDSILHEVDFSPLVTPDSKLDEHIHDCLDGRKVNIPRIRKAISHLEEAINQDSPERENSVDAFLDEIEALREHLVSDIDERQFDETIYNTHLSLTEEIYFQDTKMDGLSLGQKGTVLLKILLAEGSMPLIIDQPEENLDNRFIYKTLKDTFREAKKQRQVIIATHNANLVVNTDAEQVIVADYNENEIQFTSGPLEDPKIRDEVTTLLEGGKKAFRYREQKYGMSK
ncbi:TrlF family AAA-like ATPase [Haloarchaeobius amylolyticus]|uniref:TrlF family AAA-like ATPase n=1 Tax=Haloarchaeobius amylolyticus TaxID=1198296 RepID=A0ABD6BHL3_9EURY